MKKFKENQIVYYVLECYKNDWLTHEVFAYEWHENLKDCFNINLCFDNKKDALKTAHELDSNLISKSNKVSYFEDYALESVHETIN